MTAGVDDAARVDQEDVLAAHAQSNGQLAAGDGRGACPGDNDADRPEVLPDQLEAVEEGRAGNDGGAVLVVVEHRDVHALAQCFLDLEALRGLDVLEVDAAKGRGDGGDDPHQFIDIVGLDFDIENVDVGEGLEQHAFAFHHRFGGQCAAVAQTKDGRPVGYHGDEVAFGRIRIGRRRVALDLEYGLGHAGRVGQRQISLGRQRFGRRDGNLPGATAAVVFEGFLARDGHRFSYRVGVGMLPEGVYRNRRRNAGGNAAPDGRLACGRLEDVPRKRAIGLSFG